MSLTRFFIRKGEAAVLDPACGSGTFLVRAYYRKWELDKRLSNQELLSGIYGCDINPTVIKATLVNGYLYAPWLVRPFPFLDAALTDPEQSPAVSESIAQQAPDHLHCTEHDAAMQWQFEPIKKRRNRESPEPVEQDALLLGF